MTPALAAAIYPIAALATALLFQALGYAPCHLCLLQRWPMAFAAVAGIVAMACARRSDRISAAFTLLACAGMLASGAIGAFHAGVEYRWWTYDSSCSTGIRSGADMLKEIMSAPVVPCDRPQWTLMGVSMAGMNAVASTLAGLLLPFWQMHYQRRHTKGISK